MMNVNVRALRAILVLAEELHFGRAAKRLHLTSPALSQQIRKFEDEIGFAVFARTSRHVELTESGQALLPAAQSVVAAHEHFSQRCQFLSSPAALKIGLIATGIGRITDQMLSEISSQLPDIDISVRHLEWRNQLQALRDGVVDIGFFREPLQADDIRKMVVYSEPRVVMLPVGHRLADRQSVTVADLVDERFMLTSDCSAEFSDFWRLNPRPDGTPVRDGALSDTVEELLVQCAAGNGIITSPASLPSFYFHPRVVAVPLLDAAPSRVVLASRLLPANPLVPELFRRVAEIAKRLERDK